MPQGTPLVSIYCMVYNHEPYLRQCLDGFVMQQTDFPFQAIVHDDASTDGSAAIIREYAEKYPDIIKPIYETENQFRKFDGSIYRIMNAAVHPDTKYIAYCEGDDYWTDSHKLQIQIDFLESHPDYYMTCHAFDYFYENTKEIKPHRFLDNLSLHDFEGFKYCTPSVDHYWNSPWFTQLLTIIRRNTPYIEDWKRNRYAVYCDYISCYYMLRSGGCALFKDVMGVYRKHDGGAYSSRDVIDWIEVEMENYYCMYDLEKEKRVLSRLDEDCADLFWYYMKEKRILKSISFLFRHIRKMPITHSVDCVKMIFGKSTGSAMRRIKGMFS